MCFVFLLTNYPKRRNWWERKRLLDRICEAYVHFPTSLPHKHDSLARLGRDSAMMMVRFGRSDSVGTAKRQGSTTPRLAIYRAAPSLGTRTLRLKTELSRIEMFPCTFSTSQTSQTLHPVAGSPYFLFHSNGSV